MLMRALLCFDGKAHVQVKVMKVGIPVVSFLPEVVVTMYKWLPFPGCTDMLWNAEFLYFRESVCWRGI